MSVRELNNGFIGLRVQRQIPGEDRLRIKNFSYRMPVRRGHVTAWRDATANEREILLAKATALDAEWATLQKEKAHLNQKPFDPFRARTNTGIVGIRYAWAPDGDGYMVEAFWINLTHERRTRTGRVRLACRDWPTAWEMAVQKLAEIKGLDAVTVRKIIKAMPTEKRLRVAKPKIKVKVK